MARTDARGVQGLDEAIERAKRYLDAGADWIFPEALADKGEFEAVCRGHRAPLVANMTEFGQSPLLVARRVGRHGLRRGDLPGDAVADGDEGRRSGAGVIAAEGTQAELLDLMQSRQELYDLIGYSDYEARDREYFSGGPDE